MHIPTPEAVGSYVSTWGEGPIWDGDALLYVDIEAHKILRFNPLTGEEKIWDVGERVGTVVARKSGGLVYAGDKGISFLDTDSGCQTPVVDPEADISTNRFNDGKCDPAGRFWAGTMHLGPKRTPSASLYCLHTDYRIENKFSPVTVSNGLVWTKDTQTMYYIDTPRQNVIAFDFDNATGAISNERVVLDMEPYRGTSPDGMTIDADDNLWVAFCHGGAVRCFDPLSGKLEAEVKFPCIETTACAFGGSDFGDLYVTTGKKDGEEMGGRLFVTRPGVVGVQAFAFGG